MASRISNMLRCFVNQIQGVENAASDFFSAFDINTAAGAQLDLIGEWLGEPRLGQTDDEYRDSLYFKIATNTAAGTAEFIIETILRITDASFVRIDELFPAKMHVQTDATDVPSNAVRQAKKIVAAGVGFEWVNSNGNPFVFDTDSATYPAPVPPTIGLGFDELNYYPGGQHVGGQLTELITTFA